MDLYPEDWASLQQIAAILDRPVAWVVRRAMADYIQRNKPSMEDFTIVRDNVI